MNLPELPDGMVWRVDKYQGYNGNPDWPFVGFGIGLYIKRKWWDDKLVGRSTPLDPTSPSLERELRQWAKKLLADYNRDQEAKALAREQVKNLSGVYPGKVK